MCRQYLACYEWCRCEEDAGYSICAARKRGACFGIAVETVHMHCFCYRHATSSWKSERKSRKRERKMAKKKRRGKDVSEKAAISTAITTKNKKKKWYHWCKLRLR